MIWRTLFLTYPIWGTFAALGIWSLFASGRGQAEGLLAFLLLPILLTPAPVWFSPNIGMVAKILLTPVLYAYAYVAFLLLRFGIACAVFRFSCAMG